MRWTDSAIDLAVDFGKAQLPPGYFRKFVPFVKMVENEDGRHMAYGIATSEDVDKDREICDYGDTAPQYKIWSDEIHKATTNAGQEPSLGNIRIQHSLEMGGKVVKLDFEPGKQQVWIGAEPKNEEIWDQLRRGFFSGFSQGGKYLYRKCNVCKASMPEGHYCSKCKKDVVVRYAARISEVSLVDNPCLEQAHFAFVKGLMADKQFAYVDGAGSTALRKFALGKKGPMDSDPGQRQDQEALPNPEPGMPSNNGQADPLAREIKCGKCGGAMKCTSCGCGMPEATHPASKLVSAMEEAVIKLTPRHSSGRFTNRASGEAHDQLTAAGYDHVGTGSETPYAANGAEESPSPTRRYKNTKTGRTVTLHDDGRWNSDNGHGTTVSGRGIDTMVSHVQSLTKKSLVDDMNDCLSELEKGGPGSGPHPGYEKAKEKAAQASQRASRYEEISPESVHPGTRTGNVDLTHHEKLQELHEGAARAHGEAGAVAPKPGGKFDPDYSKFHQNQQQFHERQAAWHKRNADALSGKSVSDELNKGVKYLVTEPDGTTHLPYTDSAGNPDHNLMGAAYAALTSNHRGQPYAGPDKEKALAHLKHVYESESMDLPGKTTLIDILQDAEQQLAKAS